MPLIQSKIIKKVLPNGLTIIINPVHNVPRAALEMWYNVGSKDEKTGEKGLAHLIEHMIFKGTKKMSESDINAITDNVSAYANAFTSHDVTAYVFELPSENWPQIIDVFADCMTNAKFDEQMLNSEFKAVIQELKMYKDQPGNTLVEKLLSTIFSDHPYHYPIIGFKQDLWSVQRDTLFNFYKKHYVPNNATLIVVGDVDADKVIEYATKAFAHIKKDESYKKEEFYMTQDLLSQSVTVKRDIQQPVAVVAGLLPHEFTNDLYIHDAIALALGSEKGSRLVDRLVDELQLVTELETFVYSLHDRAIVFVYYYPKNVEDIPLIDSIIHKEIAFLGEKGLTRKEIEKITKLLEIEYLENLETVQARASLLGQTYCKTGDETYFLRYTDYAPDLMQKNIKKICLEGFSSSLLHGGKVLPLSDDDKKQWKKLQELSDLEDQRILDGRMRTTEMEAPLYALSVHPNPAQKFDFYKATKKELSNGLTVLYYNTTQLPKIDLVISFKAKSYHEPKELAGIYAILCDMLLEGTKKYPGTTLAQELEQHGIHITIMPGSLSLSMLSQDLEKALELLHEILTGALFEQEALEKVLEQHTTAIKLYLDNPNAIARQLVKEAIYKDHPYSHNSLGTLETISKITQEDLKKWYKVFFTPQEATMALVGDLENSDALKILEKYLASWTGNPVANPTFPPVLPIEKAFLQQKYMNRDQVVLAFVAPTITFFDPRKDALSLFEHYFCGNSMNSQLFTLREQTGLFYKIKGGLTTSSTEEPGYCFVETIVSLDKLHEAEKIIKACINSAADRMTEDDLVIAKRIIKNNLVQNFVTNKNSATTFLTMERFKLAANYFDTKAQKIETITLDEVKAAAKAFMNTDKMVTIQVGRVGEIQ